MPPAARAAATQCRHDRRLYSGVGQFPAHALHNAGFAFHVYCLLAGSDANSELPGGAQACPTLEEKSFSNADSQVATTQEALMMTEFGSTPSTEVIGRMTAAADAHRVSWLWWAYSPRIGLDIAADPPDQKLIPGVADLLIRAYPQAIAGTPTSWSFDAAKHVFELKSLSVNKSRKRPDDC